MNYETQSFGESYRPRIIIWSLADPQSSAGFALHECLLVIDSIARTAKPIVVLTGENLLRRGDLFEIVEYGTALGLKIIVEARPEELTTAVLERYERFGSKIFRIVVDGCVRESPETRFEESREFQALRDAVRRLREESFEIHLRVTVVDNDIRALAFYHDFAVRSSAEGLYCHIFLHRHNGKKSSDAEEHQDEIIEAIARMKRFSSREMYVSPQCVKYGIRRLPDDPYFGDSESSRVHATEWAHQCLGGKTFAFISTEGKVQICAGQERECGNLRENGYHFDEIWTTSEFLKHLRDNEWTCSDVQCFANELRESPSIIIEE